VLTTSPPEGHRITEISRARVLSAAQNHVLAVIGLFNEQLPSLSCRAKHYGSAQEIIHWSNAAVAMLLNVVMLPATSPRCSKSCHVAASRFHGWRTPRCSLYSASAIGVTAARVGPAPHHCLQVRQGTDHADAGALADVGTRPGLRTLGRLAHELAEGGIAWRARARGCKRT